MNTWLEYLIVFIIVAISVYYVWTKIIFKKSRGCSGCNKCAK
ncbi:FeoB-associated Cys-rich membrane protein [Psychrobacter piscatorii]